MGARTEGAPAPAHASRGDRASARHRRGRDAVPPRFPRARPAAAAGRDAVGQRRNAATPRSAKRDGFVREGVPRSSASVLGEFLDEGLLGRLVQDWKPDSQGRAVSLPDRTGLDRTPTYGYWRGVSDRPRMWAVDGTWEKTFTALVAHADTARTRGLRTRREHRRPQRPQRPRLPARWSFRRA